MQNPEKNEINSKDFTNWKSVQGQNQLAILLSLTNSHKHPGQYNIRARTPQSISLACLPRIVVSTASKPCYSVRCAKRLERYVGAFQDLECVRIIEPLQLIYHHDLVKLYPLQFTKHNISIFHQNTNQKIKFINCNTE